MPGQYDIIVLNQSIARGAIADARQILNDYLDKVSANKRLKIMGEEKGFVTFEDPDCFDGWRVMRASDLAILMYGTSDTAALGQLFSRYGIETYTIRALVHDTRTLIKQHFRVAASVSNLTFCSWKHFLLAGLKGETDLAKDVGAYVLAMEMQGRIGEEMAEQGKYAALRKMVDHLEQHEDRLDGHDEEIGEIKNGHAQIKKEQQAEREEQQEFNKHVNGRLIDIHTRQERTEDLTSRTIKKTLQNKQKRIGGEDVAITREAAWRYSAGLCMNPTCRRRTYLDTKAAPSWEDVAHLDHGMRPRCQGGNLDWDYLQILCGKCNQIKQALDKKNMSCMMNFRPHHPEFIAACVRHKAQLVSLYGSPQQVPIEETIEDLPLFRNLQNKESL